MRSVAQRSVVVAFALDLVAVIVFVVIGRRTHQETSALVATVTTMAPFLVGLTAAWVVNRGWEQPWGIATGARIWAVTVVIGLLTRRYVFDDGTAVTFMIVTALFLGTCLLGWRLAVGSKVRRL